MELYLKMFEMLINIFQTVLTLIGSAGSFFFVSFMVLIFTIILLIEYHDFKKLQIKLKVKKKIEDENPNELSFLLL